MDKKTKAPAMARDWTRRADSKAKAMQRKRDRQAKGKARAFFQFATA